MRDGPRRGGRAAQLLLVLLPVLALAVLLVLPLTRTPGTQVADAPTTPASTPASTPPASPLASPPTSPAPRRVASTRTPAKARSGGPGPASRSAQRVEDADPLSVTLAGLRPAVLPKRGPVILRGSVTNTSDDTWTTVNVYPFLASSPITTPTDFQTATQADPTQVPGGRIVETDRPATFDTLDRLDPGESAAYRLRIPHDVLEQAIAPGSPGVYRIGVQALGADSAGRDTLADGRAFTFAPLVGDRPSPTQVSMVVPVRRAVGFDQLGALRGIPGWTRDLGPDGRLTRLVALGAAAPARRLTWLVDPAVLDAVRRLAEGNPVRDLGATTAGGAGPSPSASPGEEADAVDEGSGAADPGGRVPVSDSLRTGARQWLERFTALARRDGVLGLPYGDLDVAAATQVDPQALARATALSASTFSALGIAARAAVSGPAGWLKPTSVAALDPDTTILASDAAVAGAELTGEAATASSVTVGDRPVTLYDAALSAAVAEQPAAGLALRQRLVSEAGLRSLSPQAPALVLAMPDDWDPGATRARFFRALERPWLDLVPEPAISRPDPPAVALDQLVYPEREAAAELPSGVFEAAGGLRTAGATLQNLLVGPTTVGAAVAAESLTGTSYSDRDDPGPTAGRARAARGVIDASLGRVTISAPEFVTLSSGSNNRFRVDVSNDLPQPVRIRIKPVVDEGLRIGNPGVVDIEGGGSASMLLAVRSGRLGYHQVDLQLTNPAGSPLGSHAELPIRSSRTGRIIWVILAAGAALLFGAIFARLLRRFRRHRATARTR